VLLIVLCSLSFEQAGGIDFIVRHSLMEQLYAEDAEGKLKSRARPEKDQSEKSERVRTSLIRHSLLPDSDNK
jgi:hypothetical protein